MNNRTKPSSALTEIAPLDIVGSTAFGRYPKISIEQTFNMIISDGWLVDAAGYKAVQQIQGSGTGRSIYASTNTDNLFTIIDNNVYISGNSLTPALIGKLDTFLGDVSIAENNAGQIAFCDQSQLYIYNVTTGNFSIATLPTGVKPGYVTFQDTYFIVPDLNSSLWFLSAPNNGLSWLWGTGSTAVAGALQTKPDRALAAIRFPGRGNLLLVLGSTVGELWYDSPQFNTPITLFPYQRSPSINIDYGLVSSATLAAQENIVAWVGQNEKSGPVILWTTGGDVQKLSNDGIDFKLAQLSNPSASFAFFLKQDGHLIYQVTFYDPRDNVTYQYDFNTQKFFTMTDQYMNNHIARKVAFFNNNYYFVSANDSNLYNLSTNITTYNGFEMPRVRVCKNFRLPGGRRYVVNNLTFTMEMGVDTNFPSYQLPEVITTESNLQITTENNVPISVNPFLATYPNRPRIDLSVSKDGGYSFGSSTTKLINRLGKRQNMVNFWSLGIANDFIPQFRFWGMGRFTVNDGFIGWYQ